MLVPIPKIIIVVGFIKKKKNINNNINMIIGYQCVRTFGNVANELSIIIDLISRISPKFISFVYAQDDLTNNI